MDSSKQVSPARFTAVEGSVEYIDRVVYTFVLDSK